MKIMIRRLQHNQKTLFKDFEDLADKYNYTFCAHSHYDTFNFSFIRPFEDPLNRLNYSDGSIHSVSLDFDKDLLIELEKLIEVF